MTITRVLTSNGRQQWRGYEEECEGVKVGKWLGHVTSEKNPGKRDLSFMKQSSEQELEKGISKGRVKEGSQGCGETGQWEWQPEVLSSGQNMWPVGLAGVRVLSRIVGRL